MTLFFFFKNILLEFKKEIVIFRNIHWPRMIESYSQKIETSAAIYIKSGKSSKVLSLGHLIL